MTARPRRSGRHMTGRRRHLPRQICRLVLGAGEAYYDESETHLETRAGGSACKARVEKSWTSPGRSQAPSASEASCGKAKTSKKKVMARQPDNSFLTTNTSKKMIDLPEFLQKTRSRSLLHFLTIRSISQTDRGARESLIKA